jgi:hypothetical protein
MMEELCSLMSITGVNRPIAGKDDDGMMMIKRINKVNSDHLVNLKGAYAICSQLLDIGDSDCHGSVCISSSCGPILVTFDARSLL